MIYHALVVLGSLVSGFLIMNVCAYHWFGEWGVVALIGPHLYIFGVIGVTRR